MNIDSKTHFFKPRGRWTGEYYIWMAGHELFQEMV